MILTPTCLMLRNLWMWKEKEPGLVPRVACYDVIIIVMILTMMI